MYLSCDPQYLTAACFTESLSSLLWNLHKYYSQFSDCIHTKISQLRQPIEKELKVYLSISILHCTLEL